MGVPERPETRGISQKHGADPWEAVRTLSGALCVSALCAVPVKRNQILRVKSKVDKSCESFFQRARSIWSWGVFLGGVQNSVSGSSCGMENQKS